jgi:hypothetical protein
MFRKMGFWVVLVAMIFCFSAMSDAAPKGAKALFDSGEGPTVGVATFPTQKTTDAAPVQKQKYVGISYELLLLTDDGQIKKVSKNRVFKSGERLIMRVMANRSGNLKIYNIGPTGNTNVLYDDYIEAFNTQQIPRGSNFRFVGAPGTETLVIMLSDATVPSGTPGGNVQAGGGQYSPPSTQPPLGGNIPTSQPDSNMIASSIDGAKKIKGSKDIVVEDKMGSSFAVVSPANNWKPAKGAKDIVVESSQGTNYGVVPVSALSGGGALSLVIKLQHR